MTSSSMLLRLMRFFLVALLLAWAPLSMGVEPVPKVPKVDSSKIVPFEWGGAGKQTTHSVGRNSFIPTIWVVGDPHLVATALRGVARVIHPNGGSGKSTLLMPAVRLGLVISLFFACVAFFTKGKIAWASWLGMTLVAYTLFINTSSVLVQTYFTYSGSQLAAGGIGGSGVAGGLDGSGSGGVGVSTVGGAGSFEIVDDVPLGFAIPAAVAGAISTGLADLFSTSFSTVHSNSESGTQFVDPLKQLLALRSSNPCLSTQLCSSIFSFTRHCLKGTVTTGSLTSSQGVDLSRVATSPDALKAIFITSQENGALGTTQYFSPTVNQNDRLGQLMSCEEAGRKIYADAQTFPTNTAALIDAGGDSPTVGKSEVHSAQNNPLTEAPAVLALQNLMGQTATDAATNVVSLVMWKAVEAGLIASNKPFDQAQFTAMTIVTEAMERWRVDGAAEGSIFLRGMFTSMNVLLFVLICMTPMVFLISITMLGEGGTIIKEYILTIVWTQTWFPTAVVINYYITEATSSKLQSFALSNINLMFAPVNHVKLYEELGTAIASAGWMMGMVPLLSYALLRGSTQGLVALATKAGAGGAQYADETTAAPSVAKASGGDMMQTANASRGFGPMSVGSTLQAGGGGTISVGATTSQIDSSTTAASQKQSAASADMAQAAVMVASELLASAGHSSGFSTGRTATAGNSASADNKSNTDATDSSSSGVAHDQALKKAASVGITGADIGTTIGTAAVAGSAAYAATHQAKGAAAASAGFVQAVIDKGRAMGMSGNKLAALAALAGVGAMVANGSKANLEASAIATEKQASEHSNRSTTGTANTKGTSANLTDSYGSSTADTSGDSAGLKEATSKLDAATTTLTNANENSKVAGLAASNAKAVSSSASIAADDVTNSGINSGRPMGNEPSNSHAKLVATAVANGQISPEQAASYSSNLKQAQGAKSAKYGSLTGDHKSLATGNAALAAISSGSSDPKEAMIATAALADVADKTGYDRPAAQSIRDNALRGLTAASAAERGGSRAALAVDATGNPLPPSRPSSPDPTRAAALNQRGAAIAGKVLAQMESTQSVVNNGAAVATAAGGAALGALATPPTPPSAPPGKPQGELANPPAPPNLSPTDRAGLSGFSGSTMFEEKNRLAREALDSRVRDGTMTQPQSDAVFATYTKQTQQQHNQYAGSLAFDAEAGRLQDKLNAGEVTQPQYDEASAKLNLAYPATARPVNRVSTPVTAQQELDTSLKVLAAATVFTPGVGWATTVALSAVTATSTYVAEKIGKIAKVPAHIAELARQLATKDMPAEAIASFVRAEAGGNFTGLAKNANSQALGTTQFIPSTWLAMAVQPGTRLNLEATNKGLVANGAVVSGKATELLALRIDNKLNIGAAVDLAKVNLNALRRENISGLGNLQDLAPNQIAKYAYTLHLFGQSQGIALIKTGEAVALAGPNKGVASSEEAARLLRAQVNTASNPAAAEKLIAASNGDAQLALTSWLRGFVAKNFS